MSNIRIEVKTESNFTYSLELPFGSSYEEAFVVLEQFKTTINQMQQSAKERAEEEKKAATETKGE
jgi:hypothetical protein